MKAAEAESNPLSLEALDIVPEVEPKTLDPLAPKHFVMERVPEELFVPAGEEELVPHAPVGLNNPFWNA